MATVDAAPQEALIAESALLVQSFLYVTGLEAGQLRAEAGKPAFFVGLLDLLMANEADLMDFASAAGLDPAEIGRARDALLRPT